MEGSRPLTHRIEVVRRRGADIAGALSKMCRFGGQIDRFYSVAEHSCLCCWQTVQDGACEGVQRAALMHDAAEAYIGDIASPLKPAFYGLAVVEARILGTVYRRFGVVDDPNVGVWAWPAVRGVDEALLATEKRDLLAVDVDWEITLPDPLPITIRPWPWRDALDAFRRRFEYLFGFAAFGGGGDGEAWYREWDQAQGGAAACGDRDRGDCA
jgi:hypothetical protein